MGCLVYEFRATFYFSCFFYLVSWIGLWRTLMIKYCFFPPKVNESNLASNVLLVYPWVHFPFCRTLLIWLLFFMNSNQLYALLNLTRYFVWPLPYLRQKCPVNYEFDEIKKKRKNLNMPRLKIFNNCMFLHHITGKYINAGSI